MAGVRGPQQGEFKFIIQNENLDFSAFFYLFDKLPKVNSLYHLPTLHLLEIRETYLELKQIKDSLEKKADQRDVVKLIENFLKNRWERIRGTPRCYTQIPDDPYSNICINLASLIAPILKKHPFEVLIPSLKTVESPITGTAVEEHASIKLIVLSDDETYPIDVVDCLSSFQEGSEKLYHTHHPFVANPDPKKKGILEPAALSDKEVDRVKNHSQVALRYYQAVLALKSYNKKGSIPAAVHNLTLALNKGDASNIYGSWQNVRLEQQHNVEPLEVAYQGIRVFRAFLQTLSNYEREQLFSLTTNGLREGENFKEIWLRMLAVTSGIDYTEEEKNDIANLPNKAKNQLLCVFNAAADFRHIMSVNEFRYKDLEKLKKEFRLAREALTKEIKNPAYPVSVTYKPESNQRLLIKLTTAKPIVTSKECNFDVNSYGLKGLLENMPKTPEAWDSLIRFLAERNINFFEWIDGANSISYAPILELLLQFPSELKSKVILFVLNLVHNPNNIFYQLIEKIDDTVSLTIVLVYIKLEKPFLVDHIFERASSPEQRTQLFELISKQSAKKMSILLEFLIDYTRPGKNNFTPPASAIREWLTNVKNRFSTLPEEKRLILIRLALPYIRDTISNLEELLVILASNITDVEKSKIIENVGIDSINIFFRLYQGKLDKSKLFHQILPFLTSAAANGLINTLGKENYLDYLILNLEEFFKSCPADKVRIIFDFLGLKTIQDDAFVYASKNENKEKKSELDGKEEKHGPEFKEEKQAENKKLFGFLENLSPEKLLQFFEVIGWDRSRKLLSSMGEAIQNPEKPNPIILGFIKIFNKFTIDQAERFLNALNRAQFFPTLMNFIYFLIKNISPMLYGVLIKELQTRGSLSSFGFSNNFLLSLVKINEINEGSVNTLLNECSLPWLHAPLSRWLKQADKELKIDWPSLVSTFDEKEKAEFHAWVNSFPVEVFREHNFNNNSDTKAFFTAQKVLAQKEDKDINHTIETLFLPGYSFSKLAIIKIINQLAHSPKHFEVFLKIIKIGHYLLAHNFIDRRHAETLSSMDASVFISIIRFIRVNSDTVVTHLKPWILALDKILHDFSHSVAQQFSDAITPKVAYLSLYYDLHIDQRNAGTVFDSFNIGARDLSNLYNHHKSCFMYYLQILLKAYIHDRSLKPEISSYNLFNYSAKDKISAATMLEVIIRNQPEVETSLSSAQKKALTQGDLGIIYSLYKTFKSKYPQYYQEYLDNQPNRLAQLKLRAENLNAGDEKPAEKDGRAQQQQAARGP